MNPSCHVCHTPISAPQAADAVAAGICDACLARLADPAARGALLEAIDAPVLLMQGDPRLVVTANARARGVFAKALPQVEGHRGGQVFDCLHSFTVAGCGKDENCEHCLIKGAIVDTFATGTAHRGVATVLPVKKAGVDGFRALQVSTRKAGQLALVRIERYETTDGNEPS